LAQDKVIIMSNFIHVSCYNNDISWLKEIPNDHIVYDRSENFVEDLSLNKQKRENIGYNIHDIADFIVSNYKDLPEYITFCKGNVFPRHVSREFFFKVINNKFYTPIFDYTLHEYKHPISMVSSDGLHCEIRNNWFEHWSGGTDKYKYFYTVEQFMSLMFKNFPTNCLYYTFAPGANYVVGKAQIQRYSIDLFKKMRDFVSYTKLPIEAHIIERSLHSIFSSSNLIER